MISIIIASANAHLLADVSANISKTIGVEYEIISFDNVNAKMGICEIYNKGIAQAKYNLLCLMHEDIKIYTDNWGRVILDIFDNNAKIGLLGVAGSTYKALVPSSWFSFLNQFNRVSIIQHFKFRDEETEVVTLNPKHEKLSLVTGIDGVWLCTHKKVTNEITFDEQMLKGFHGYDVDFSLSVGEKWDICITYDVLLEHFSEGNYDRRWVESILKVHKKWSHSLPRVTEKLTLKETMEAEKKAFLFLIETMKKEGYSKWEIICALLESKIYAKYGWLRFFRFAKYIWK